MKLAVCIVNNRDKGRLREEMVRAGFKFTIIGTTGGFLREGNTTFLVGVSEEELPSLQKVVEQNCQSREQMVNLVPFEASPPGAFVPSPVKVPIGGAVLFVLDVEGFYRY